MENSKRYIGVDCPQGHGGERYKSNWRCVRCSLIKKYAARKAKRAAIKAAKPIPKSSTPEYKEERRRIQREKNKTPENREAQKLWLTTPKGIAYRKAKKAKYHAASLKRTPKWLTKDEQWMIKEAYALADLRTKLFGFPWEVDHKIPLQGKLVSGLHTPYNLQVIPKTENRSKGNSFGPK
jgi:hypothetical protein